jgi:hypothetical protein
MLSQSSNLYAGMGLLMERKPGAGHLTILAVAAIGLLASVAFCYFRGPHWSDRVPDAIVPEQAQLVRTYGSAASAAIWRFDEYIVENATPEDVVEFYLSKGFSCVRENMTDPDLCRDRYYRFPIECVDPDVYPTYPVWDCRRSPRRAQYFRVEFYEDPEGQQIRLISEVGIEPLF